MKTYTFTETDLASRAEARQLRSRLFQNIDVDVVVELNFKNVLSISDSFADEFFGVLAAKFGVDGLAEKVKIDNASRQLFRVIASNIQTRTQQLTH
tara:strand:+ start:449 stop:736 length:288 start_codon:yes stop_codon:yes gene_type:complete